MKIIKFRCAGCRKGIISKNGSLHKELKLGCRYCGHQNIIKRKGNGSYRVT